MGFIDTSTEEILPVFYNVVHAVGRQCPNLRDDVKLIQYLLLAFYDKGAPAKGWKRPPGELTVTGFCGPTTMNWILDFQMNVRKIKGKVAIDGRIDRVRNKNLIGSITGTYYTLAFLNKGVAAHNREAFAATPLFIPLENPMNIPPPSNDLVLPKEIPIPSTGGF